MMTAPSNLTETEIGAICARFGGDPHRMLDILLAVQARRHWISPAAMETIAAATGLTRIAVEGGGEFLFLPVAGAEGSGGDPALRRHRGPFRRS